MAHKGPHISISPDYVVNRILRINIDDFAEWPESVRHLAIAIAEELFLVAYNPFINVETVRNSVHVPSTLVRTKASGSRMERSTWLSAAKLTTASG